MVCLDGGLGNMWYDIKRDKRGPRKAIKTPRVQFFRKCDISAAKLCWL